MSAARLVAAFVTLACVAGMPLQAARAADQTARTAERSRIDYDAEIAKLRPLVGNPATHDRAMNELGELAVRAAIDLEVALALGDQEKVERLDRLIREKLGDTRLRVERRAQRGDADAIVALGMFQARNLLAARNEASACSLFVQAAERGHIAGSYQAALCVLKTDPAQASAWMQRAADAGHPAAQEAVGRACLQRTPSPQLECAARYVGDAARVGRPSAQSLLAWMYANGVGVSRDPKRAAGLYLEAARRHDRAAQNNLGELYEKGLGVNKNERLAVGWYRQAAQAGFPAAQFNLGRMYALGLGVKQDWARAREWLQRAESQGIAQAGELIRWLDRRENSPQDK